MTGQPASRTILSIRSSACCELAPSSTSATSGRSRAVTVPTHLNLDLAGGDLVPERGHDRDEELETILALIGDQNP